MKKLLAPLLALLSLAPAAAQTFPPTLPANTVYGRLSIGPGPAQAIPFSVLSAQLSAASSVLNGISYPAAPYAIGDILQANTTSSLARLPAVATGNALISGGVGVVSSWGKIGLTTHVSGTLPETSGGTNQNTYTTGDLLQATGSNTLGKLNAVATGNALISGGVSTASAWGKIGLTTHVSGTLAEGNGGTNQSTYAQGDTLFASAANTLSKLAKDTGSTRYLSNTGTNNNPAWAQIALGTGVTGTLPCANMPALTGGATSSAGSCATTLTLTARTRQVLNSGTGATYTRPTSPTPIYLVIRACGGGGGGAGSGTTPGATGNGGATTFNSITGNGGTGANVGGGGPGGTGGAGTADVRVAGGSGTSVDATATKGPGGNGASGPFGGQGAGGTVGVGGNAAATNSCSGGGGGGVNGTAGPGGGGGAGEYIEFIITSPASTFTYTVGAAGTAGSAGGGGTAGGAGAAGKIIVDEFYQ